MSVSAVLQQIRVLEFAGDLSPSQAVAARAVAQQISERLVDTTIDPAALQREIKALVLTGRPPDGRSDSAFDPADVQRAERAAAQIAGLRDNLAASLRQLSEAAQHVDHQVAVQAYNEAFAARDYDSALATQTSQLPALQRRVEESPSAAAYRDLGEAYRLMFHAYRAENLGHVDESACARQAVDAYQHALALSPTETEAFAIKLGRVAIGRAAGQPYDPSQAADEVLALTRTGEGVMSLVRALSAAGEPALASLMARALEERHPDWLEQHPEELGVMVMVCATKGLTADAAAHAAFFTRLLPEDTRGWSLLGYTEGFALGKQIAQGDTAADGFRYSAQVAGSGAELEHTLASGQPSRHATIALAYLAGGDVANAQRHAQAYIDAAPKDAAANRLNGFVYGMSSWPMSPVP